MIRFVSYKQFSDFGVYCARNLGLNGYQTLSRFALPISTLSSWSQLREAIGSDSLFDDQPQINIFDYSGLELADKAMEMLASLALSGNADGENEILVINREFGQIPTEDKKIIKSKKITIEELKSPDKIAISEMLKEGEASESVELTSTIRNYITTHSSSYDQALNYFYIAQMSDNNKEALEGYQLLEKQALFVLPWRTNNLKSDAVLWYKHTAEDELQLALSLLMTKTSKWPDSNLRSEVMSSVIRLDNQIKSSTASEMTAYHSMLWKLGFDRS